MHETLTPVFAVMPSMASMVPGMAFRPFIFLFRFQRLNELAQKHCQLLALFIRQADEKRFFAFLQLLMQVRSYHAPFFCKAQHKAPFILFILLAHTEPVMF